MTRPQPRDHATPGRRQRDEPRVSGVRICLPGRGHRRGDRVSASGDAGRGCSWGWDVPVLALGIVLVGALQHRLAGLGHEAAHYTLLKNKLLNDLVGDVFCMFPILSTVHFYRLFHLAHHQYTNDPERDPDLVTLGGSKMVERFPMSRWEFIKAFYLRAFTEPLAFLRYEQDYIDINVLGRSENVYLRRLPGSNGSGRAWPRLGAVLGLIYLLAFIAGQWAITSAGRPDLLALTRGSSGRSSSCRRGLGAARDGVLPVAVPPAVFEPDLRGPAAGCTIRGSSSRSGCCVPRRTGGRPSTSGCSGSSR